MLRWLFFKVILVVAMCRYTNEGLPMLALRKYKILKKNCEKFLDTEWYIFLKVFNLHEHILFFKHQEVQGKKQYLLDCFLV